MGITQELLGYCSVWCVSILDQFFLLTKKINVTQCNSPDGPCHSSKQKLLSWQLPTEVHDALLKEVCDLGSREENDASRVEEQNKLVKESEPIRLEQEKRLKAYVQTKCDELTLTIRKYIDDREIDTVSRAKILQDIKVADSAYQTRPQDISKEDADRLRGDLLSLYVVIAEVDTNMKCIAADESAHRATLDAYLKVLSLRSSSFGPPFHTAFVEVPWYCASRFAEVSQSQELQIRSTEGPRKSDPCCTSDWNANNHLLTILQVLSTPSASYKRSSRTSAVRASSSVLDPPTPSNYSAKVASASSTGSPLSKTHSKGKTVCFFRRVIVLISSNNDLPGSWHNFPE